MLPVKEHVEVLTPDGVIINYRLASFSTRLGAAFIDLGILVVIVIVISTVMSFLSVMQVPDWLMGVGFTIGLPILVFGYYIFSEGLWSGRTIGKRMVGLQTIMVDGTQLTFPAATLRNLLRVADFIPVAFLGALITMNVTRHAQRIGDLIAGTLVVHEPKLSMNFSPAPHRFGIHPLEEYVGSLKRMTLRDYVVMKRLADRFPSLTREAQDHQINDIWEPFAARNHIKPVPGVHPMFLLEAVVMRYGRQQDLL